MSDENKPKMVNGHAIKTEGYNRGGFGRQRREQRQKQAIARQKAYDKLSLTDKITMVRGRPGANARELARLELRLREQTKTNKTETKPEVKAKVKKVSKKKD